MMTSVLREATQSLQTHMSCLHRNDINNIKCGHMVKDSLLLGQTADLYIPLSNMSISCMLFKCIDKINILLYSVLFCLYKMTLTFRQNSRDLVFMKLNMEKLASSCVET